MRIATLSIGDELLCGEVVDTNAARIGERLYRSGLAVHQHMTVGDQEQDIVEALLALAEKSDAVVVTGGLGPTVDDITARAAARATGRRLVLNEDALAHVRQFAGKVGKGFHPLNEKEALIPASATLIPNPTGTACGFHLGHNGRHLLFMPGVPGEMWRMLEETVIPFIEARRTEKTALATKVLKVFGLSEAEVDALLKGVVPPDAGVQVAFGVDFPEVHVKLRAEGGDAAAVAAALERASAAVRQKLKAHVFGEDGDTFDDVVAELLRQKKVTLSLAESCTGGLVAKRITDMPGSSDYFIEGAVTYADAAKVRVLGVSPQVLADRGAVSSETAMAMAKGIRKNSGSDVGLAITGIAGPGGGSDEKPVGTVFIALASRPSCHVKGYRFAGNRDEVRTMTACMALDWLRRHLASL